MKSLRQRFEENSFVNVKTGVKMLLVDKAVELTEEWIKEKPSDYVVNYYDDSPPTSYLDKAKLLEELGDKTTK